MHSLQVCLWFDTNAEDAAKHYVSIFPGSKITHEMRYGKNMPMPEGTLMTTTVEVNGLKLVCLNGGPHFKFNEAVSLMVPCDTQAEVDAIYNKLLDGGIEQQCGWVKDKFGVSWQIAPVALQYMMSDKDPQKVARVSAAMMQMKKLDLPTLQKAFEGQ
jgi:two-component system sensor histidine kinase QseC